MDEMTCINTKHLAEKVKRAFTACNNGMKCHDCPYKDVPPCGDRVRSDAITVINGYQEQIDYVVEVNEKNVSELCKAKMEIEYRMDQAKWLDGTIKEQEEKNAKLVDKLITAEMEYDLLKGHTDLLEEDIRALKENNAKLAEQNKKLLEKEIENTKLRNENQSLRDENKDLDERNDKLCDELRHRNDDIRNLLEEIDRQNKELYHRREWEQLVRSQPMILHTEPVKIESVSCDVAKMAKAADKATKACHKLTEALEELDKLSKRHSVISKNDIRSMFGMPPLNPKPWEIAKVGDVFGVKTLCGNIVYYTVSRIDRDGICNNTGAKYTSTIVNVFRLHDNGDLKLIWG